MKRLISFLPEMFFLAGSGFIFLMDLIKDRSISYPALAIIALIITLLLWKNKIYALFLSYISVAFCLFMFLALWSELSEFTALSAGFWEMLIVGHLLLLSIIVSTVFILIKYIKQRF
ncbi:hypothetical protein [Parabacteroides sp. Marseille-P3160]|uniref:hypothetical protein n=1 Tax=Parabacteroides sp. Marseille-P3160 TaxID=1917887 RepID=UPI0009BBD24D|nr:hypothetical protein [Parabacteroides sp. Marseille-P3160]